MNAIAYKSRAFFLLLSVIPFGDCLASQQADVVSETISATIERVWSHKTPGIQVGVWVPGQGDWIFAKGQADVTRKKPMKVGMQQQVGSITKTMTGTLILQLVERGQLSLSDPLSKWYPSAPEADNITIAMLLNMSSGISTYNAGYMTNYIVETLIKKPRFRFQHETLAAYGLSLPRVFDSPGADLNYSNTNTVLLGQIAEQVTGKSYGKLLQQRIFVPLGMKRSFLQQAGGLRPPNTQTYLSLDDGSLLKTTQWSGSWAWAAGAVASTLGDLRRWALALGTGQGVLESPTQALRDQQCAPKAFSPGIYYCLGVPVKRDPETGKLISYWHNGKTLGATAWLGYFPQTGSVMAILANGDAEGATPGSHIPDDLAGELQKVLPDLFVTE